MLKRIEDYTKTLPIVEVYRCVQSEGSRLGAPPLQLELQDVLTVVGLVKVVGVILGTQVSILKKVHSPLTILLKFMMKTLK